MRRNRPGPVHEKAILLQHLERRASSERRWAATSLWVGVAIIGLVVLCAIFAPLITPSGPNEQDLLNTLQPPSWAHPFGTDNLGRDIFSRTVYAARIDLLVGLVTTYVPLVLGVGLGLVRRLPGRLARDRRHARSRRRRRVPVHRARDRGDRDRRARAARRAISASRWSAGRSTPGSPGQRCSC